ncbi:hypothetical protein D3C78_1545140 [compost metagenome]
MIGNGFGVGVLVMGNTLWRRVVIVTQQGLAEYVAHANNLADITLELQLAFNEGLTQLVKAWVGELADQLRLLDQDRHLRARPKIELVAVPQLQTQR